MKIPGATIARPTLTSSELPRDAPTWGVPLFPPPGGERLAVRPVTEPQAAEFVHLRHREPASVMASPQRRFAEHAVSTYEAVQQLRQREGLRSISGIDVYA